MLCEIVFTCLRVSAICSLAMAAQQHLEHPIVNIQEHGSSPASYSLLQAGSEPLFGS